ncbi:transposase [Pseudoalteromonas sp. 20-MNA-CIBAN-0454]|uniref:REP-associated tyrosine transposase n=1 Tax=Pseudoalteromonas sp. 20-MNA-CIBAN-0454 TaxID=3140424 RepID=UPI00332F3E7E
MFDTNKRVKGRYSASKHYYAITICCHNKKSTFKDFNSACLVAREISFFTQNKSLQTICYSLMPDHLHWLFQLQSNVHISKVVGQFKSITTVKLNRTLASNQKIWQPNYYDHKLRYDDDLINQARYIVANPLRAKLVQKVGDYPFWDCTYLD